MGEVVKVHNIDRKSTPLFVNGRRVDVPHNEDFPLADAYVEVLRHSRINFTSQGKIADKKSAGYDRALANDDEFQGGTASATAADDKSQVPGADSLVHAGAGARRAGGTIVIPPAHIDQVPGGDNLVHAGAQGEGSRDEREAEAIEQAERNAEAARDGTQEPVAEIVNTGTNQDSTAELEAARLAGTAAPVAEPVTDPAAEPGPLDQSIPGLEKHLRRVRDVAEIDRLIGLETGGKSRKGALEVLAARRQELTDK